LSSTITTNKNKINYIEREPHNSVFILARHATDSLSKLNHYNNNKKKKKKKKEAAGYSSSVQRENTGY